MMNYLGIHMKVTCNARDVLHKLKANRAEHSRLVAEARLGYIDRAQAELTKKLDLLRGGKLASLAFALKVPVDYTPVYDNAIHMLEAHAPDTIMLSADEWAHLVEDKWDWTQEFVSRNSSYSSATQVWALDKGFELKDE